jgi:hypothetical protein
VTRAIRIVSGSKRRLTLAGVLVIACAAAFGAFAYFTSVGSGTGSANAGTLTTPGQPTRTGSGSSVHLGWTAATVATSGTISYHVERSTDPVTTWSDACGTNALSGTISTSCTDSPSAGTYRYRVTAIFRSWTAVSSVSDVFVVAASDTTPPYVLSIDRTAVNPTSAGSVGWMVTFSESVTGVDASDFTLAASGVSGAGVTAVSGSGATRTVTASTGSGDGTVRLDLVDDNSIQDGAANPLGTSGGAGDGSFTGQVYTVDKTAPTVSSINRKAGSTNPTNAASLDFTVTFSEPVSNVVAARFAVAATNVTGTTPTVGAVTPVGSAPTGTWTVTVSTSGAVGANNGSVRLDLTSVGTIQDTATNLLAGTHTGDQSYTYDTTAPTVSSINRKAGSPNPTNAASLDFTVAFSEPVSNVVAARFAVAATNVTGTTPTVGAVTPVGSAPTGTWTVSVSTSGAVGANNGSVRLDLTSVGAIQDTATNLLSGTHTGDQSFTFDTTAPAAPTSVSLANGGGAGNAFINNANKTSVNINVALPAGSSASDTVSLTVHDVGSAHTLTVTASATAGAGTVAFTGLNLSAFNDGTITISATSSDTLNNTSGSTSNTATKDTVAPTAPTAVSLTNGGGSGSAFINNANKASVNYSVTLGSGSAATDTISFSANDAGSAHVLGPLTTAGTSGAGSVSFNANNLTTFNDGTISASATATDQAGNASGATSTTNTKDVVAPNAPTAVTLTNGGGTGNAFINNANKASVNYSVTLAAGSVTSDTVSFSANDAGSAHTLGPLTTAGTSGGGSVNFNANNLTTFNDGTITASATATDQAGNASGATSTTNTKDVVAPNAPTAVTLTNGGGAGNAFINNANKASVDVDVALPAGSSSSDTVTLTVHDPGSAHTLTRTASATAGAGTVHFTALDLSSFNDGTITMSATSTDLANNASASTSNTASEDVVAPAVPTAVTLTNGGGTGSAFINNANKASVNYSVTLGSGSLTTDTVSFSLADAGNAHTLGPLTTPGTSGAGTVNFNANNLTAFNDGAITASATSTDQAGNASSATSTAKTKDVVAPTAPTAVTLTNGGGTGSAFINNANKASVNYSVTLASGSVTSDTISFSLADGGSAHTLGPLTTAGTSGSGTVSFNSNNLTTFNDSTITASATATDQAGNTSGTTSATNTKDVVAPTNTVTLSAAGSAALSGTTVYYKGNDATAGNRTFKLQNAVADGGSGPASSLFAALGGTSTGFTFTTSTVSTPPGGPYISNAFTWANPTTSSPTETVTGSDTAGNTAQTTLTFTNDITGPTNVLTLVNQGTVAGTPTSLLTATRLYYNGSAASGRSFQIQNAPTDVASGPASSLFGALAGTSTGFSFASSTVSTPAGGPYASNAFTWTSGTTSPPTETVTGADAVGNTTASIAVPLTNDITAPTSGALTVNGTAASAAGSTSSSGSTSFTISTRTDYTEAQSTTQAGLAASTLTVQSETLTNFSTCGAPGSGGPFMSATTISGTTQPAGIVAGFCYLYALVGTDNVGNTASVKTTVIITDTFDVSDPGTQTAGTAFNVTITAKFGGVADTSYTGSRTVTFSGPANAPDGTAPTYPATVTFTNGVGIANITLFKSAATTLTATDGAITGTSPSFTVSAGSAAKLAWTNIVSTSTTAVPSPCLFTCSYGAFGNQVNFTAKVSVTDSRGNILSDLGSGHTVSVTRGGDGGSFTTQSGANPQALTIATTGLASSTATFTFNSQNGSWASDTLTAHTTGGTSYTDATATLFKN